MSRRVMIVDYGMGNLRSVQKALERVGAEAVVTADAELICAAERLVLPGVGAFGDAMAGLRDRGLLEPVTEHITQGKPFLGICLGLQLLFEESHEDGRHRGLGILEGTVERFPASVGKVPHMGWNQLRQRRPDCPLLTGIADGEWFYFVHSYRVVPADEAVIAGQTDYGVCFCSMVWRDRLYATQFHPEKSQRVGLQLLRNFLDV